ncbi:MAG: hypothetical protein BGO10_02380 [Chlamydia sp. 32-24]|nr:MAG: hypothetical protein BGO10_02380 [Chlamydia sp. 32-24]
MNSCHKSLNNTQVNATNNYTFFTHPTVQKVAEVISILAIAIIAVVLAPKIFLVSSSIGFCFGASYIIYKKCKQEAILPALNRPTCAPGSFEFITGVKIPASLVPLITAVYFAIHMPHSPHFVSFFSLLIGFRVGTHVADWSSRHINSLNNQRAI